MQYAQVSVTILLVLLIIGAGATADPLLSLQATFPETWNNGNVPLPGPGMLKIPSEPGILSITLVQEPYRKAGTQTGPDRVLYTNYGSLTGDSKPGIFLGTTYYQRDSSMGSPQSLSDNLPLTSVTRYYTGNNEETALKTQLLPAIETNTNHQFPGKIHYSATWEPLDQGQAISPGCDITGTWKTDFGNLTIACEYLPQSNSWGIQGKWGMKNEGTFEGIRSGPILTGTWKQTGATPDKTGRYTFHMKDSCCAFTGTWGTGESDINLGTWSGVRS
jgi:hypothetical protein